MSVSVHWLGCDDTIRPKHRHNSWKPERHCVQYKFISTRIAITVLLLILFYVSMYYPYAVFESRATYFEPLNNEPINTMLQNYCLKTIRKIGPIFRENISVDVGPYSPTFADWKIH